MVFKKDTENKQLYKQEIMNHMLYGYTESPEPHTIDVKVDLTLTISNKIVVPMPDDFTKNDLEKYVWDEMTKIQILDENNSKCPVLKWEMEDYYEI